MDPEEVQGGRQVEERRASPAFGPSRVERRRGQERRAEPRARLLPALLIATVSVVELAVAEATRATGWPALLVVIVLSIAAFDLAAPPRWRPPLSAVWLLVVLYAVAVGAHSTLMIKA